MLHLLINPVSRYTLFFQLPKQFKFDTKPQNTNSALQITLLHPFKSDKLSHQRKENSRTAASTIQTEASKKVTCIIDSYFIIYMCCTFISISVYIIHIIRLVCIIQGPRSIGAGWARARPKIWPRLFEAGRLLNFPPNRISTYSRWALI